MPYDADLPVVLPHGVERYLNDENRQRITDLARILPHLTMEQAQEVYRAVKASGKIMDWAALGLIDRFYLIAERFGRVDIYNPWLYARCREVEADPDGYLDLWARDHYKSTIITYAGVIQEILRDPEITVAIFSHVKPIAKKFLFQIAQELENNGDLKMIYADVLWSDPKRMAPKWSLDDGIIIKRLTNPKEPTIFASGVVDGQPTSMHFRLRVYDDVVTEKSVTSAEMVLKTTDMVELSDNLGTKGGREWFIGTRYSFADSYGTLLDRGVLKPRIYPATDNGLKNGSPVFLSVEQWENKKIKQPRKLAAQMLQNPAAGEETTFDPKWLKQWWVRPRTLNIYILGDPSKGKNKKSDYTGLAVVGIDYAGNKYLLDGYRERMPLSRRWAALKGLHKRWSSMKGVLQVSVGYEQYGLQADLEYFEERMREEKYSFPITEVNWPREGPGAKTNRVERLQPDFVAGRFFLPGLTHHDTYGVAMWDVIDFNETPKVAYSEYKGPNHEMRRAQANGQGDLICKPVIRKNSENQIVDLTVAFIEEFLYFPFGSHDDLIDGVSRLYDMEPMSALVVDEKRLAPEVFVDT